MGIRRKYSKEFKIVVAPNSEVPVQETFLRLNRSNYAKRFFDNLNTTPVSTVMTCWEPLFHKGKKVGEIEVRCEGEINAYEWDGNGTSSFLSVELNKSAVVDVEKFKHCPLVPKRACADELGNLSGKTKSVFVTSSDGSEEEVMC